MKRREFITLLGGAAAAWPLTARAQQPSMPVVGFLGGGSREVSAKPVHAFLQGLGELGYVEGRNVGIEYRWADGRNERLPGLAADLVRSRVNVIATAGATSAALAAKAATETIPIVFQIGSDPVEIGLVASLNRPGKNITGVTSLNRALGPKRVEVLHELLPSATIVAQLFNPTATAVEVPVADAHAAAVALGLQLHVLHASTERDFDMIFETAVRLRAGGLVIAPDPLFSNYSELLAAAALRHGMPTISAYRTFVSAGGLMSYGGDLMDQYRQIGIYTGRILKGEKPADLPVEQATKIELLINLKTAKALSLTVPLSLLGRADEVIE
jgi:putative ABC transport system substrate-binding protein